jgi:choline/glycine/proline betaine transport protein
MTVFGNSAIDQVVTQGQQALATMVNEDTAVALFVFLEQFPFSSVLSFIAVLMVVVFFVTSCDSGAMVVDMLCSHGKNDTPLWQRVYWAVGVGVVSSVLLYAGGLGALQTMTIAAALPFAIVLLIALSGLLKALRVEAFKRESLQVLAGTPQHTDADKNWKERLENIVTFPDEKAVQRYITKVVAPALTEVGKEFELQQFSVSVDDSNDALVLTVSMGNDPDFIYAVYAVPTEQPEFGPCETQTLDENEKATYYRAEVHLSEGGQNYDIMGWSKISVINDVIDHYHKHQHFIHLLK